MNILRETKRYLKEFYSHLWFVLKTVTGKKGILHLNYEEYLFWIKSTLILDDETLHKSSLKSETRHGY